MKACSATSSGWPPLHLSISFISLLPLPQWMFSGKMGGNLLPLIKVWSPILGEVMSFPSVASGSDPADWDCMGSQQDPPSFRDSSGGMRREALPPLYGVETIYVSKGCSFRSLITNRLAPWSDKPLSDLGLFPKSNLPSKETRRLITTEEIQRMTAGRKSLREVKTALIHC